MLEMKNDCKELSKEALQLFAKLDKEQQTQALCKTLDDLSPEDTERLIKGIMVSEVFDRIREGLDLLEHLIVDLNIYGKEN